MAFTQFFYCIDVFNLSDTEDRFFFILCYLDVFSRKVVDYYIGLHCKGHNLVATLQFALKKEAVTIEEELVIRSDNGTQMRCKVFKNYLESLEMKLLHEYIPIATPNKNAHVESFFSILELECLEVNYFNTIEEVCGKLGKFIDFYNNTRIHSSLKYRAPAEIVNAYRSGDDLGKVVKTSV